MSKTSNSATSPSTKKNTHSSGAPSQLNQGSRKGKRAWRKNVDLEEVEQGLENIRAEERVTGSALHSKTDKDLFTVDLKGDDEVRRTLPRFSKMQLTSSKILAQRSAVPAVASRVISSSASRKKPSVKYVDKERLLRMGKRNRRGPFNAVMDPTEFGAGSALLEVTEAVKESGKYDPWATDTTQGTKVNARKVSHPRSVIELPAVTDPHQGTSYNPTVFAHQQLLRSAHEVEEQRIKTAEEHVKIKEKVEGARRVVLNELDEGIPTGMTLDEHDEADEHVDEASAVVSKSKPERKTKQQRRKAEKQRAEKRALAEKLAKRKLHSSITMVKSMRKSLEQSVNLRERVRAQKQRLLKEKMKHGLAGQRLGRHTVKEADIDVQLGEDLSESLRALKPEGNLFKDRFISMQQRALVEPRTPVIPKKTRVKFKEIEKHAWKRFD